MQRNEHATATKHENKLHGSDLRKKLNKSPGLRHRQIDPLRASNKHGKTESAKQISDLAKLTLV